MRRALGVLLIVVALGACGDDDPGITETGVGNTGESASPEATGSEPDGGSGDPETVTCESGGDGTASVDIEDFQFQPDEVTIAAGDAVSWVNRDSTPHSVWSDERSTGSRAWQSVGPDPAARAPENLPDGAASTCTFPEPGTYAYLCGIHNTMVGTIVVT